MIAGNCGPGPGQVPEAGTLFRHTSAHSAPTIDDISSARIGGQGILADRLRPLGARPVIALSEEENSLELRTEAYRDKYGVDIVRRLTLMGGGHTLVGQDSLIAAGRRSTRSGEFIIRFHLAPEVELERSASEDLVALEFRNGARWAFLWEGALADIEDSVRHSSHFGLVRTRQIVLSGSVQPGHEIAWVFTRQ